MQHTSPPQFIQKIHPAKIVLIVLDTILPTCIIVTFDAKRNNMVHTIDLMFQRKPNRISVFLMESPDGPILFETGPHSCLHTLEDAIQALGHDPRSIQHVFITHIHLDHAGSAWHFAKNGATIYLHPFGQPHMIDPSRFIASARMIYQERMDELWGQIEAIEPDRLQTVNHLESVRLGSTSVMAHHTPGHAKHHIAWQVGTVLFTGDVAGISINDGPAIPPCPPPDINIEQWKESIDAVTAIQEVDTYYLGHFGKLTDIVPHMTSLKDTLDAYANFVKPFHDKGTPAQEILEPFQRFVIEYLTTNGVDQASAQAYNSANPPDMSVLGLLRYWKKFGDQNRQP